MHENPVLAESQSAYFLVAPYFDLAAERIDVDENGVISGLF